MATPRDPLTIVLIFSARGRNAERLYAHTQKVTPASEFQLVSSMHRKIHVP